MKLVSDHSRDCLVRLSQPIRSKYTEKISWKVYNVNFCYISAA